jgi:gas vesicle protein
MARNWFEERQMRFESETKSFFDFVGSHLRLEGAAIEESLSGESQSTQLLEELNLFISPLKDQFQIRLGGFGNFLNSAIRDRIRAGVLESTNLARRQMLAYVNTLTKYPWNTLRAAVRKSGTFVGSRRVDLRGEFSSAFISPMASVWSTQILSEIKTKTNAFAEYQEQAIREIIGWARSNKLRPSTRLLDALAEEIKQNRIRLVGVGKNAVSELREKVKEKLYESVQEPIDSECRKFVRRGNDVGAGVLGRMHELLYDLVEKVADELNETVESLLLEQFRVVAKEIREALREDYNPLDDAIARLIPKIESVSQKEIEKNKSILASIYHAVESAPSESKETTKAA